MPNAYVRASVAPLDAPYEAPYPPWVPTEAEAEVWRDTYDACRQRLVLSYESLVLLVNDSSPGHLLALTACLELPEWPRSRQVEVAFKKALREETGQGLFHLFAGKSFPDRLLQPDEIAPMLPDDQVLIITQQLYAAIAAILNDMVGPRVFFCPWSDALQPLFGTLVALLLDY